MLTGNRVTLTRRVPNEENACEKIKEAYTTVGFGLLRDPLLLAARMRPVIGFYIFNDPRENFRKWWKSMKTYNSVRFASFRDALAAAPGMRPVVGFYIF